MMDGQTQIKFTIYCYGFGGLKLKLWANLIFLFKNAFECGYLLLMHEGLHAVLK